MLRSQQRFAVIWCVFILLQQFDVILTLNINDMRTDKSFEVKGKSKTTTKSELSIVRSITKDKPTIVSTAAEEDDPVVYHPQLMVEKDHPSDYRKNIDLDYITSEDKVNRERRAIGEEASVIRAIGNTADKIHKQDANVTQKISSWIPSCDSKEESNIKTFWEEQKMLYPTYLIFSSVSFQILMCQITVENRVKELVQLLDYEEIVSFLDELSSDDLEFLHKAGGNNDTLESAHVMVDPEGPENAQTTAAVQIVASNFGRVQEMNNVINQLDNNDDIAQFSRAGLDEYLDDVIMEYDTVSNLLLQQGSQETSRKKRHILSLKHPTIFAEHQNPVLNFMKRKLKKFPRMNSIESELMYRNAMTNVAQTLTEQKRAYDSARYKTALHRVRSRRSVSINRNDLNFFTVQESKSCRVLTPADDSTSKTRIILAGIDYDKITDQLWYRYDDYIVHATRDLFLTLDQSGDLMLDDTRAGENQRWALKNNVLIAVDEDLKLVPDDSSNELVLAPRTNSNLAGTWNFSLMTKEGMTSCTGREKEFFVIQHKEKPCETLCASADLPSPSFNYFLPLIISGFVAIAGISMSVVSYKFIESKRASMAVCIFGMFLSVSISAGIAILPIITTHKDITTKTETINLILKSFEQENPDPCSWYKEPTYQYVVNVKFENVIILEDLQNIGNVGRENLNILDKNTWAFDGGKILSLNNKKKDIGKINHESSLKREVRNTTDSWRKITIDSPSFFEEITCLYILAPKTSAQTMNPKCEEFPWLFQNDILYNNLWYHLGQSRMKNLDQNSSVVSLLQNDVNPMELTEVQNECRGELFFIQNKDIPCEVLTYESDEVKSLDVITFSTFDYDKIFNQLWLLRDGALIHFRSGWQMAVLENSSSVTLSQFGDQWTILENQTIVSLKQECHLQVSSRRNHHSVKRSLECSTNSTKPSIWELVPFDSDYLDKLVCVYFIQNQLAPCESLTGYSSTMDVKMAPVLVDTLESQLWYMLNKTIYHLVTGFAVGIKQDDVSLSLIDPGFENDIVLKWNHINGSLLNSNEPHDLLAVDTYDGSAYMKRPSGEKTEKWKFLDSQTSIPNPEKFSCSLSHTKEYFFIKLSSKPCDLLTAGDKLKPPTFVPFEEEKMTLQLWYWDFGHLINLGTGLSLQISQTVDNQENFDVILADTYAYRRSQLLSRKAESILSLDNACTLGIKNSHTTSRLVCSNHLTKANSQWRFLPHEQALDDIAELVCVYFIRNNHRYCEFLTEYDEENPLKVRPLLPELVERQLFFWKKHHLINMKTDLPLAISDIHSKVVLRENMNTGEWAFVEDRLVSTSGNSTYLTVDIHQDGVVKALSYSGDLTQSWTLFEMRKVFEDPTISNCPLHHQHLEPKRFFIKHTSKPCLVLTTSELGNPPVFKVFNKHEMQKQLWTFENNHIINDESGLALMLDNERIHSNRVAIMWHVYEYSHLQKWGTNERNWNYFSIYDHNLGISYFLSPFDDAEAPTVIGKTKKGNGQWQAIEMDEDFEFHDEITCHFFLKNPLAPCELLTGQGMGERVVVRPVKEAFVTHQLWTFEGKKLRNVGSGLYLTWYGKYLILTTKKDNNLQNWRYASRQLIQDYYNTIVRIEHGTGHIVLERRLSSRDSDETARKQWIKVDKQDGVDNPEKLMCETRGNPELYVIRSEHRDCPVLTDIGTQAGVRAVESPDEANIWVRSGHHIINSKTMKALSVQNGRHRVYMENIESNHETRQHWTWRNDKIISNLKDGSNVKKYLTYSSYYVQTVNYKGTDEQQWVWNTLEAVQEDGKLLRCSRCYNKREETAAEVMGYIPIFGWLYNLFRSVTYAIKDCPKVALDAFKSFAIDILIDIAVALSMGALSAIAYGVKTAVSVGLKLGLKAGIKAGVKAGFKATKAMIKLSVKAAKSGFKNLIKNGITKTLKLKLNMMMSATKMTLKAGAKALKKAPSMLKSLTQGALRGSKKIFSKSVLKLKSAIKRAKWTKSKFRSMSSNLKTKLKHLPKNTRLKFRKVGHSVSKSLKKIGNKISKKAENAVNKVDDLKKTKKTIRCRRSPLICNNSPKLSSVVNDLKKPNKEVEDTLTNLRDKFQMRDGDQFTQRAAIITKKSDSQVDTLYLDSPNTNHRGFQTEKELLDYYENTPGFKDCKDLRLNDCQFSLYSYNNPCLIRDNCADLLRKTCKRWFNEFRIKCLIGFTEYNGDDNMKRFIDQVDNLKVKPKKRAESMAKELNIENKEVVDAILKEYNKEMPKWQLESALKKIQTNHDLLKNADESIDFYHIVRNPDNILPDSLKLKTPNNEVQEMITKLQDSVPKNPGTFRQRAAMVVKKGDDDIEFRRAYQSDLNEAGTGYHTEEYMLQQYENSPGFRSCRTKNSDCQFFLYSYNSPCLSRKDKDSCTELLRSTCRRWFDAFGIKCHIGFTDYYGDADTFKYIKELKKNQFRDTNVWVNAMAEKLGSNDMGDAIRRLTMKDMTDQELAKALKKIQTSHHLLKHSDESIDFYHVGSAAPITRGHG